jgi:hypothetical protein
MILPEPEYTYTIIVDYDENKPLSEEHINSVLSEFNTSVKWIHVKASASGGTHYIIQLTNPVSPDLVPLIELLLGSDPFRCCLLEFRRTHGFWLDITWIRKRLMNARSHGRSINVFKVMHYFELMCPSLLSKLKQYAEYKNSNVYDLVSNLE